MFTAASVALSALGLGAAIPAHAAPLPQHVWDFTESADWYVPDGTSTILVGLHGGNGGSINMGTGGRGADFAVQIPVTQGDRITVYPAKDAKGRKGGKGWTNGGDGGGGSLSGADGGGGGGAAAVKLNGQLVAVAGGGGGGGGYSGDPGWGISLAGLLKILEAAGGYSGPGDTSGSFTFVHGGNGGASGSGSTDGRTVQTWPATWGEGKHSTAPGQNGKDDAKFAGYGKSGGKGGSAAFATSGGGGGGGGGGWPASGTGGGPGRKFLSYSAGSGGGTGMSWVSDVGRRISIDTAARRPEDMHDYFGPLSETGKVRIMVPVTSTTKLTAPAQVEAGQDIPLRVRTADTRTPNTPLHGWVDLYQGSTRIKYATIGGDHTFTVPGLPAGTHQFRAEFRPTEAHQRDYKQSSTYSQDTVTVTVVNPVPPPPPGPSEVASATSIDVAPALTTYGDTLAANVTVEVGGGVDITGQTVTVEVDEVPVGTGTLVDAGNGIFTAGPVLHVPPAGNHVATARFAGSQDADPSTVDVLPSASVPVPFSVARAATATAITQAPSAPRAFEKVDVAATVRAGATAVSGQTALYANGGLLAYGTADIAGEVLFDDVVLPWGTETLTVEFLGDANEQYASSTSPPHPVAVTPIATLTTLSLSSASVRADQPVTMSATVTNALLGVDIDPRGAVEFLFDDEVVHTVPTGMDSDPDVDDGEATFEFVSDTLPIGAHQVTARFVPEPGFGASASAATGLELRGIPTVVVPREAVVSASSGSPVTIEIASAIAGSTVRAAASTALAAAGDPLGGHIEASLGAASMDAFEVVSGRGVVTLSGLPAGTHEVRLRFVPESPAMLESSTTVTVNVTAADEGRNESGADGTSYGDNGDRGRGALPDTGAGFGPAWALGLLLIAAGAVFLAISRRARRRT